MLLLQLPKEYWLCSPPLLTVSNVYNAHKVVAAIFAGGLDSCTYLAS